MSLPWRSRQGALTMGKREILRRAEAECGRAYQRGVIAGVALGMLLGVVVTAAVASIVR